MTVPNDFQIDPPSNIENRRNRYVLEWRDEVSWFSNQTTLGMREVLSKVQQVEEVEMSQLALRKVL